VLVYARKSVVRDVAEVQQLYKQWQEGRLLDSEERKALRSADTAEAAKSSFAEVLKGVTELDS